MHGLLLLPARSARRMMMYANVGLITVLVLRNLYGITSVPLLRSVQLPVDIFRLSEVFDLEWPPQLHTMHDTERSHCGASQSSLKG